MASLFWRQFKALSFKNLIGFRNHWLANLLRCLLFPIAYGTFLSFAPTFFSKPNTFGVGSPAPVFRVQAHFDGSKPIFWVDNSGGNGYISAKNIMNHVTLNFTTNQLASVHQLQDDQTLGDTCKSNFNGGSACYITITFDDIPTENDTRPLNYTIRSDYGAFYVDVINHRSDLETRVLPMQWAIDQAIIELTTGQQIPLPLQLPFSHQSYGNVRDTNRLVFLNLVGSFVGIAFLVAFTGILYQLAGGVALERANLLTSHMQAMGAFDSARILSWYFCISGLYIPGWIILALIWRAQLFTRTSAGLLILAHLLTGFSLASWAFFASVFFRKSAQLAAVVTTLLALVLGVIPIGLLEDIGGTTPAILSFFFPPMFYVFILKDFAGFEVYEMSPNLSQPDPTYLITALPMVIAVLISIFFWPCIAIYLERWLYGVSNPSNTGLWSRNSKKASSDTPHDISISLRNVQKTFNTSFFKRKSRNVVAIEDLTLDISSRGIFVLLGPNGAGKSTTLSILGGLLKATGGEVTFSGNTARPPHGTLGIVPQKNVLFPELSCLQTLRVWNAIKQEEDHFGEEDLEKLIYDCDLQSKMHEPAVTLSGGQKRKLQLAIGLVGGSQVILVDECTSGVDPLSRRSLWKTLTTYRTERTIILTTHFLDEADFLADRIAVLAAPGKLIASDTPVALKSSMGEGYTISVRFASDGHSGNLLQAIRSVAPDTTVANLGAHVDYHLKTKDTPVIAKALHMVESLRDQHAIRTYDVLGTTIEEIFLHLLAKDEEEIEDTEENDVQHQVSIGNLSLSSARSQTPWAQARTIFYKRYLVTRRSWLVPLLAMAIGISGAWWPIRYVKGGLASCAHTPLNQPSLAFSALYPPKLSSQTIYATPPSLLSILNTSLPELFVPPSLESFPGDNGDDGQSTVFNPFIPLANETLLVQRIDQNFVSFNTQGGLAMDFSNNEYLIAYSMDSPRELFIFSMASNLFYARALNSSNATTGARRIIPSFDQLPTESSESLTTLQWLAIFGAAMAVFPAFFSLYVAKERHSQVQAMQLSNGLSNPSGLWLGHFMFDSIFSVVVATVISIVYGAVKHKFQGVGLLWLVMCLYGFAGTLLAYVAVIVIKSPLGAFSALVVSQFIIYLLYLTGYIVVLFSDIPQVVPRNINIIHFTLALVAPINSVTRAAMVSVNQFSLLCDGEKVITSGPKLVSITRYGGPILYLVMWTIFLLFLLGQVDSGIRFPWSRSSKKLFSGPFKEKDVMMEKPLNPDVLAEAEKAVSPSNDDPLRVLNVSKSFKSGKVVDNVTFTISHNSLFVMLGPNGAGKTTTFDMIRGHLYPDAGDVQVNETSVLEDMRKARVSFGVCPQFTAMDAHLTVKEHLLIYGRFRGLSGEELSRNIHDVMKATGLVSYYDRLATKLSGGNQRKLALAIALMGNPSVVLIDEYSTGIDARMKRELWAVLKQIASNKSVFLTTHSMEEASYLATKVGIMSKRMLAVGTPEELESRNASYEVHFACKTPEEMVRVKSVMAKMPGARMVDDVATRFEVPVGNSATTTTFSSDDEEDLDGASLGISTSKMMSVATIFEILSKEENFPEFTVGKSSLETAFIRVINDDYARGYVDGEGAKPKGRRLWHLFSS